MLKKIFNSWWHKRKPLTPAETPQSEANPVSADQQQLEQAQPVQTPIAPVTQASEQMLTDVQFVDLPLHALVQRGLQDAGFTQCTPIQAETLPIALQGLDVAGQAQTGTGKTAAFLLVIFNRLLALKDAGQLPVKHKSTPLGSLVLAPTRELAVQIYRDAELLGKHTGLRMGLAYGGVDYEKQRREIEAGMDLLIGTPGRIIDYLKQGVFTLNKLEVLVLDEADRMFDLGFIKDIRYLLHKTPPAEKRQALLFSATMSLRVTELAYEHMNSPQKMVVEAEQVTADNIEEQVLYPANEDKLPLLAQLLKAESNSRAIVFVNTRHIAKKVAETLRANGVPVALLSGNVPQDRRQKLLDRFHRGDLNVLVATDVAARGLHIPAVSHVVNFDLPQSAEDYVHRIGRTARLGASGHAISFACEHYAFHLPEIEDYIGYPIPEGQYQSGTLPKLKKAAYKPDNKSSARKSGANKRRPQRRRPPAKPS